MKTIISHFYNEEYLLPWWLNHHKKCFDHGILINYFSDDNSINLIKEICPTWDVINTRNESFDANLVDKEVSDIEKTLDGWRIVLNTTEFLIGNFSKLEGVVSNTDFFVPPFIMIDSKDTEFIPPDPNQDLIRQRTHGVSYKINEYFNFKKARKLSNFFSDYPMGRHFSHYNTEDFAILWYGFSPMNDELIKRKIQIQKNIPETNKRMGIGFHHLVNGVQVLEQFKSWQSKSVNLESEITKIYKP